MISFNQEAQALMRELEQQLLKLGIDADERRTAMRSRPLAVNPLSARQRK